MRFELRRVHDPVTYTDSLCLSAIYEAHAKLPCEEINQVAMSHADYRAMVMATLCEVLSREVGKTIRPLPKEEGCEWAFEVIDG